MATNSAANNGKATGNGDDVPPVQRSNSKAKAITYAAVYLEPGTLSAPATWARSPSSATRGPSGNNADKDVCGVCNGNNTDKDDFGVSNGNDRIIPINITNHAQPATTHPFANRRPHHERRRPPREHTARPAARGGRCK